MLILCRIANISDRSFIEISGINYLWRKSANNLCSSCIMYNNENFQMHLPRRFQLLFLLFKLLITNRSNYVPVYTLQCERTQLTRLFVKVSKVTLQTLFADTLDASSDRFVENGARLNISLADSSYQNLHRSCSFLFFVNTFTTPESNNSYREREGMSQGTSSGPNVLFDKTHDVACIIYHARGESWLYSASIEH